MKIEPKAASVLSSTEAKLGPKDCNVAKIREKSDPEDASTLPEPNEEEKTLQPTLVGRFFPDVATFRDTIGKLRNHF